MNPQLKNRWIEALYSNRFQQGQGALNSEGKFCCLGVLCEIVKDEIQLKTRFMPHLGDMHDLVEYGEEGESGLLPAEVAGYADINSDWQEVLVEMNDGENAGFEEIADWVEKNL